jgi:hypothetical protein
VSIIFDLHFLLVNSSRGETKEMKRVILLVNSSRGETKEMKRVIFLSRDRPYPGSRANSDPSFADKRHAHTREEGRCQRISLSLAL